MKFGYACQNHGLKLTTNRSFRLASYTDEKLVETVGSNLEDLKKILAWNVEHGFLFFRIGSQLVPFASHPVCRFPWLRHFDHELKSIGNYIRKNNIRVSMHPDQFVIINAQEELIVERSIAELEYHCMLLDAMKLTATAKVQIHVGGVYGNKEEAMTRFIENYHSLDRLIRKRLVIENDDRLYSVKDCLEIQRQTGIPIIFDNLHHECLNNGENMTDAMQSCFATWKKRDGSSMVDYSEQMPGARKGNHIDKVDLKKFKQYRNATRHLDFDMMLEIKDKEMSAGKIKKILKKTPRNKQ